MRSKKPIHHDESECFRAPRAALLSGHTVAMVNYLCRLDIVAPSCDCKRGRGTRRHYSFGDVVALRLVKKLLDAGASTLRLKSAMHRLRLLHPQITLTSLPASHVVIGGSGDLYLHQAGNPLERALDGQMAFAFVVDLASIQDEVKRVLKKAA